MTQPPPPPPTDRDEDARRVVEAMEQWRRRSRLIHFFRRALPIGIGAVLLALLGWVTVRTVMANLGDLSARGADIRMTNPRFYGQDQKGRSFVIGAKEAVRSNETDTLRLEEPLLRVTNSGQRHTEITGALGVYDEGERSLKLQGGVRVSDGASGFTLSTQEAVVDTRTGVIRGDSPITGEGPIGRIRASSYAIHDQGGRIVFRGDGETKVTARIGQQ